MLARRGTAILSGHMTLQVGDQVVLMSDVGRFRVVAIDGRRISIESVAGLRRTVIHSALRRVEPNRSAEDD